jgi:hypothetical protein
VGVPGRAGAGREVHAVSGQTGVGSAVRANGLVNS